MKQKLLTFTIYRPLLVCLVVLASMATANAQNAIIGTGFSTGWCNPARTGCSGANFTYFAGGVGSSRIATFASNNAGNRFFRLVRGWGGCAGGEFAEYGPSNNTDTQISSFGTEPSTGVTNGNGAWFVNDNGGTGRSYIIKTLNGCPDTRWTMFYVQGAVQTISSVTRDKSIIYPGQSITITAGMSAALPTGQGVYCRYSTDNYTTSTVAAMALVSGSNYAVTTPTFNAGANLTYYCFTSGNGLTITGANSDFFSINLNNNGGSNFTTTVASAWVTAGAGSINTAATWVANAVPVAGQPAQFSHAVTQSADVTYSGLTINVGGSLTTSAGTININAGGALVNNGTFNPTAGTVNFVGAGTVSGTAATFNNLTLNTGQLTLSTSPTVNGTFTLNGGNLDNSAAIIYGSSSTLAYTADYTLFREWISQTDGAAGSGRPNNVTVSSGKTLTMPVSGENRAIAGGLTICATCSLTFQSAGDLILRGNWTNNHTGSNINFGSGNGRAVWFTTPSGNATISKASGTESFPFLLFSNVGTVTIGSPVNITATSGSTLQLLGAGNIILGATLTLANDGGNIQADGAGSITAASAQTFALTGSKTIPTSNTGTLTIGNNVTMTIAATKTLTQNDNLSIATGGAMTITGTLSSAANIALATSTTNTVNGNLFLATGSTVTGAGTMTYGSSSLLRYDNTLTAGQEWTATSGTSAGSGLPQEVSVNAGATLTLANAARAAGLLRVNATGAITFAASSSLGLFTGWNNQHSTGANITFVSDNNRVTFNGTTATITSAATTAAFRELEINTTGNVTTAANLTTSSTTNPLVISNTGNLNLNGFALTLNGVGGNLVGNGTGSIMSTAISGALLVAENKTIPTSNTGTLTIGNNVTMTIAATKTLTQNDNLSIATGGAMTITGTLSSAANIALATSTINTVNGNLFLATGSTVTGAGTMTYGSSSLLRYDNTLTAGQEWTATSGTSAGSGLPQEVSVNAGATLTLANAARAAGLLRVNATGAITFAASSSLGLFTGWNNQHSTGANITFVSDNNRVTLNGTTATITSAATTAAFRELEINTTGNVTTAANLTTSSTTNPLVISNTGNLDLNGFALTLNGVGGNLVGNGTGSIMSTSISGALLVAENKTIPTSNTGTLTIGNNVTMTIAATKTLTQNDNLSIATGGAMTITGTLSSAANIALATSTTNTVNGNLFLATGSTVTGAGTMTYGSSSLLRYDNTLTAGQEWTATSGTSAGSGLPQEVSVNAGATLTLANAARAAGLLRVNATGAITFAASSSLGLFTGWNNQHSTGANITFVSDNNRVTFNGTTATIISAATTAAFRELEINTTGNVTTAANLTTSSTTNPLVISNTGNLNLNGFALTLNGVGGNLVGNGTGGIMSTAISGALLVAENKTIPTSNTGTLTIGNNVTMTIAATKTLTQNDNLSIATGGTVSTVGTLTLNNAINLNIETGGTLNATSGTFTYNGTISNAGTFSANAGTTTIGANALYYHTRNGGTIPTLTWTTGAGVELSGITDTWPTGLNQTFRNLSFSNNGLTNDLELGASAPTDITSNWTIAGNSDSYTALGANRTYNTCALIINGKFALTVPSGSATSANLTVGTLALSNGSNNKTQLAFSRKSSSSSSLIVINGSTFSTTAVSLDAALNGRVVLFTGNGTEEFNPGPTLTQTGTGLGEVSNTGSSAQTSVVFSQNATLTLAKPAFLNYAGALSVSASRTLTLASPVAGAFNATIDGSISFGSGNTNVLSQTGTFTLASGASINIAHTGGISLTGATGIIQSTGTRTFSTGASYNYIGASAQTAGTGLPSTIANLNLTSANLTLSNNLELTTGLSLTSRNLTLGANTLTLGGSATISRTTGQIVNSSTSGIQIASSGASSFATGLFTTSALGTLTINRSGGFNLGANTLTLSQGLVLTSGKLTIPTSTTLNFSSAATWPTETASNYVEGSTQMEPRSVGTGTLDFMGLSIAAGADDLGNISIVRVSGPDGVVTSNSSSGINCRWDVTAGNQPVSGRNVTFRWVSDWDNGKSMTQVKFWRRINPTDPWIALGTFQNVGASNPRALTFNTTHFSDWSVSDNNSPLPVVFSSIAAKRTGIQSANVIFQTQAERNVSHYILERSANGQDFEQLLASKIVAKGTIANTYTMTDVNSTAGLAWYYRVVSHDFDGTIDRSPIVLLRANDNVTDKPITAVYPNPFASQLSLEINASASGIATIELVGADGKLVWSKAQDLLAASQVISFTDAALSSLPKGIYQLRLTLADGSQQSVKLTK